MSFFERIRELSWSAFCVVALSLSVGGCLLPPAANVQDARTVGKNNVRLAGYWAGLNDTEEGEKTADELGGLFGVGVSESAEIQLRIERIDFADEDDGYQFASVGPKFGVVKDKLAFLIPAGFYFGEDLGIGDTFQFQPAVLGTIPVNRAFEVNASARVALPFDSDLFTWAIFGFGFGISDDLDRWAILPEISYSVALDEESVSEFFGYGVALSFRTGD